MFAVIKTGGKQYRVSADDVLKIGKLDGQAGDMIEFGEVLVHGEGDNATFGSPLVDGARVTAEVVEQGRARTVIAFKKRRRQNSRRKRGQRQHETTVRILEILASGQTASRKPQPAAAAADVKSEGGAKGTVDVTASTDKALESQAPAATAKEPKAAKPRAAKASAGSAGSSGDAQVKSRAEGRTTPLFQAPEGEPDDLVVIVGIGPVAAKELAEEGITTFAQLAELSDEEIVKIDANMPFSAAQIRDWREQAKVLAKKS